MVNLSNRIKKCYLSSPIFNYKDLIFLSIILVITIVILIIYVPKIPGNYLEIYEKNTLIGKYSLEENITIHLDIDGPITIIINDNSAYVAENNCPNQLCVRTGTISKTGEKILCAPKKLLLLIVDDSSSNLHISG